MRSVEEIMLQLILLDDGFYPFRSFATPYRVAQTRCILYYHAAHDLHAAHSSCCAAPKYHWVDLNIMDLIHGIQRLSYQGLCLHVVQSLLQLLHSRSTLLCSSEHGSIGRISIRYASISYLWVLVMNAPHTLIELQSHPVSSCNI